MAFLRRGLVTNKGAVPSVHTRQTAVAPSRFAANDSTVDAQPAFSIQKVTKIIKMANTVGEYHIVSLACGHTAQSKSTFQGYCKQCKAH